MFLGSLILSRSFMFFLYCRKFFECGQDFYILSICVSQCMAFYMCILVDFPVSV